MKATWENLLVILISLLAIGAVLLMVMNTSAGDVEIPENTPVGPLVVRGNVYDSMSTPIPDCPVVVNLYNKNMSLSQSLTDTTDINGYYSVTFGMGVWEIGGMVYVVAQIDGQTQGHTVIGGNDPVITINLQFNFAIPEFGSEIGGFLMVVFAVGMMVMWKMRPKNDRPIS